MSSINDDLLVNRLATATNLDAKNAGMPNRELNVQPSSNNIKRGSASILRIAKTIIASLNVHTKRQILINIKKLSVDIVILIEQKSTAKQKNADNETWNTIARLDETHVKNMPKKAMLINENMEKRIEISSHYLPTIAVPENLRQKVHTRIMRGRN